MRDIITAAALEPGPSARPISHFAACEICRDIESPMKTIGAAPPSVRSAATRCEP